jgi:hypothetical protein
MSDNECTGTGNCHGCLKWCVACGDVKHVCDMRLRGERCDEHPVPPTWAELRRDRAAVEQEIARARRIEREAQEAGRVVVDGESARRAYDRQMADEERRIMGEIVDAPAATEMR